MTVQRSTSGKPAQQAVSFAVHRKIGRVSFDDALRLQENAIDHYRSTGEGLPLILSLEHEPVITCGRSTKSKNLLFTEKAYKERGIDLRRIDRGGDVTYHGPGQVVVYPVIVLGHHDLRVGEYVRLLEDAMIRTCADWDVHAFRRDGFPGCWTDAGKIGAVGTAIKSGGITKHGLSFNIHTDLNQFKLILPCGIPDVNIVRLSDLANRDVNQEEVETAIVGHIIGLLGLELRDFR